MFSKLTNKIQVGWQKLRFGDASQDLRLVFVSGVYGKTTVADVAKHLLGRSGVEVGAVMTTGLWYGSACVDANVVSNTVTAPLLHTSLRKLRKLGAQLVIIEANFEAISTDVFAKLEFDAGVLTNLGDAGMVELPGGVAFGTYAATLFSLVHQVKPEGLVVVSADDPQVEQIKAWAAAVPQPIYAAWYSKAALSNVNLLLSGTSFEALGAFLQTKLLGNFNLANTVQAIMLCQKYIGMNAIDTALNSYSPIPGRWQLLDRQGVSVLIDYAFHPKLVTQNITELSKLKGASGRLIMVGGAAGDRGSGRLELLSGVIKELDFAILAPLDPRSQKVSAINRQIAKHAEAAGAVLVEEIDAHDEYLKVDKANLLNKLERVAHNNDLPVLAFNEQSPDGRLDAIHFALWLARPGDVIYLQGKGGDTILDFGNVVYEWDEAKAVSNSSIEG